MAAFDETAVHHCEVVCDEAHVDPLSNWYHCKNQRTHKNFKTMEEFRMEHPMCEMGPIKNRLDRTVKITVTYTSEKRPDTFPDSPMPYPFREHRGSNQYPRCGTGFIDPVSNGRYCLTISRLCPCPECEKSNQPKMAYWKVTVITATHVVFDGREAKSVVLDLFYDDETRDGVRYLYGHGVLNKARERYETDRCVMVCVTHDKDLMEKLNGLCKRGLDSLFEVGDGTSKVMVSHPHGVSKKISVGKYLYHECYIKPGTSVALYKGTRVRFPSRRLKQKRTHHSDLGVNDGSPHEKNSLFSQHQGDENSKTNEVVNPQETVTSTSLDDFFTFFTGKGQLKVDLEVFPPSGSFRKNGKLDLNYFFTLPANTKYVSRNGTSVVVPTEIQFYYNGFDRLDRHNMISCFQTYTMATCPGSSGAWVNGVGSHNTMVHFGICKGQGQTGLIDYSEMFFISKDSVSDDDDDIDDDDDGDDDDNNDDDTLYNVR